MRSSNSSPSAINHRSWATWAWTSHVLGGLVADTQPEMRRRISLRLDLGFRKAELKPIFSSSAALPQTTTCFAGMRNSSEPQPLAVHTASCMNVHLTSAWVLCLPACLPEVFLGMLRMPSSIAVWDHRKDSRCPEHVVFYCAAHLTSPSAHSRVTPSGTSPSNLDCVMPRQTATT